MLINVMLIKNSVFGGMINYSLFKSIMKFWMTLSINCRGSPAFLYFTGIGVILPSKFDVIFQDLCKFPEMFLFGFIFLEF